MLILCPWYSQVGLDSLQQLLSGVLRVWMEVSLWMVSHGSESTLHGRMILSSLGFRPTNILVLRIRFPHHISRRSSKKEAKVQSLTKANHLRISSLVHVSGSSHPISKTPNTRSRKYTTCRILLLREHVLTPDAPCCDGCDDSAEGLEIVSS